MTLTSLFLFCFSFAVVLEKKMSSSPKERTLSNSKVLNFNFFILFFFNITIGAHSTIHLEDSSDEEELTIPQGSEAQSLLGLDQHVPRYMTASPCNILIHRFDK